MIMHTSYVVGLTPQNRKWEPSPSALIKKCNEYERPGMLITAQCTGFKLNFIPSQAYASHLRSALHMHAW